MAIIDVVKYDGNDNEFVWKFPSNNLRLGSQLVVKQAQMAFFVKGGKVLDPFVSGTFTLTSGNIPLIHKLINIPFGGNSPFQAEVWFINLISKLDNKWGTSTAIQLEDPKYGIIVPVRAFGQFGFKISNPKLFLETLVGTINIYSAQKIVEYFTGKIITTISTAIGKKILIEKLSVLEMSAHLDDLSSFTEGRVNEEFAKFGIEVVNFYIMSINVPESDPSVIKLKEIKAKAMYINTVGKDVYSFDRSMDVLETAAGNEGNSGNLMGAGMGLGLGLGVGGNMGNQMSNISSQMNSKLQQNTVNCCQCNSIIPGNTTFCGSCGAEQINKSNESTKMIICSKCSKTSPYGQKFCLHCGEELNLCKNCNVDNLANATFCINCGKPMDNKCPSCSNELPPNAKFCGTCGHKLI